MATPAKKAGRAKRTTKPARRARGSLSQGEILDGAQQLVEQSGLQQLSMPALARYLKSGVTSIYWYFHSKDDLLEALTDKVARELHDRLPPVGDRAWDEELTDYFVAFRNLIEKNTVYREVFAYRKRFVFQRSIMAPSLLARLEEGLRILVGVGLTSDQAIDAFNACSNYTRGFVVLEHGLAAEEEGGDPGADGRALVRSLDETRFPVLSRVGDPDQVMGMDDHQFHAGLLLLLDGIRQEYGLP